MPQTSDLWIKVPSPFFGVETVGFSVRCPEPQDGEALPDVPFFVEGDRDSMASLQAGLRLFPERERFVDCHLLGEAYSWTAPISLSDEVIVLAMRDESLERGQPDPALALRNRLSNQLVLLAFPFLRDCVRVAGLRLSSPISLRIKAEPEREVDLTLPLSDIVGKNGSRTLLDL